METSAAYHLHLLGKPYAVGSNGTTVRLTRRLAWCLLARLTEHAGFLSRDTLCKEFMIENTLVSDNNLSQAITECRKAFGSKVFESDKGRLRLLPGVFTTDTALFDQTVRQAKETDNVTEKITLLQAAFALVRDDFLAGYARGASDWIALQQAKWEAKIVPAGEQLRDLWERQGNVREARAVADRLASLFPQNAVNFTKIVSLATAIGTDCNAPHNGSLAEWIAFAKSLTKHELTFKSEEKVHFEALLQAHFLLLSSNQRTALKHLCILNGRFDAVLAEEVCQVTPEQLSDLANDALLTEHSDLFEIPGQICQWIQGKVKDDEREKYEQAYASGLLCHKLRTEPTLTTDQKRREYFQRNRSHYVHVCSRLRHKMNLKHQALTAVEFELYLLYLSRIKPPEALSDFALLCEHTAQFRVPELYPGSTDFALSHTALHLHLWNQGIAYAKSALSAFEKNADKRQILFATITLVNTLHHSGQSASAAELGIATCERIRDWQKDIYQERDATLFGLHNQLSEILSALGRYDEALHYSETVIEAMARGQLRNAPASPHYRKGIALRGLGRNAEALTAWNIAIAHFIANDDLHGIADCKQKLGVIMAEMGLTVSGEEYVREALERYAEIPQEQSRAACLRSLGDVLKIKGDLKGAEAAYCEGLAFWENEVEQGRGGSGWVRRFRERLETFSAVPNEVESAKKSPRIRE